MIKLTKRDWEECLAQNEQIAKTYRVNVLIAEAAIEMIKKELAKFPKEEEKNQTTPKGVQ